MAITIEYGTANILPPREHACKLVEVKLVEGKEYGTDNPQTQISFTFESIKWRTEDGEPGVITLWTGLKYGDPRAKLTALLDAVFGRSLTQEEARKVDVEKLVGLQGYVQVLPHTKGDGTKTSKFGGFRFPDNVKLPKPEQFMAGKAGTAKNQAKPAPQKPAPKDDAIDTDDFEDPFAEGAEGGAAAGEELVDNPFVSDEEA